MCFATGASVAMKPVPKMIASTGRSEPSLATTDERRTSSTPHVTSSTLRCERAGYHLLDGRIRLQPIV